MRHVPLSIMISDQHDVSDLFSDADKNVVKLLRAACRQCVVGGMNRVPALLMTPSNKLHVPSQDGI